MNFKYKSILFIGTLVLAIIACSPALYMPTFADSQKAGVSTDTLVLGRNLYVNNCGSCHSLYQPAKLSQSEWAKVMPVMQKKAKCNNQETSIIAKYLNARAKQE
ncbi:MAG: hypothetical protein WCL21_15895 [Mariniphaga sp.]